MFIQSVFAADPDRKRRKRKGKELLRRVHAMQEGFSSCVPSSSFEAILHTDLKQMLIGKADIDVDDWQKHCDYVGFSPLDDTPQWFFAMLRKSSMPGTCSYS